MCIRDRCILKRGIVILKMEKHQFRARTVWQALNQQKPQTIEKVRQLAMEDCRIIIREIESEVGFSIGSVQSILTDNFCLHRTAKKFVPRLITPDQKENHLCVACDMLQCNNANLDFMKKIITEDEFWVYGLILRQGHSHLSRRHHSFPGQRWLNKLKQWQCLVNCFL